MSSSVVRHRVTTANLLEYASKNRNDGFFNDLTIFAEDEIIPANRLVLSCCSKYFEGMFKTILRNENIIEFEAVDGATMKALIDFIYTGSITINEQNVMNLLSGAEYLKFDEVKTFCFEFLRLNFRPDHSTNILKIANLSNNENFKNEIKEYISTNFEKVVETDEFKALSKDDLIFFISELDHFLAKETSIYQAITLWTRHNEEVRGTEFYELIKMFNLDRFIIDFFEKSVLEENSSSPLSNLNNEKHSFLPFRDCKISRESESLESQIISMGGSCTNQNVTVVFSLSQKTSQIYPKFAAGKDHHCSVKLDDHIYTVGGRLMHCNSSFEITNEAVKINLRSKNEKWERVTSMNLKRISMGASVFRDTLFVAGGGDEKNIITAKTEFYVPAINNWISGSPLLQRRYGHALVSCNGYLYALGGWGDGKFLSSVERLENLNCKWKNIAPMQTPRLYLAAVPFNGFIYAIGGKSNEKDFSTLKTVERYDPALDQWENISEMNIARRGLAACVLCGKIYVVGGLDAERNTVKEMECYEPIERKWNIVGSVADNLKYHTLVAV